jgi:hypothetical protein
MELLNSVHLLECNIVEAGIVEEKRMPSDAHLVAAVAAVRQRRRLDYGSPPSTESSDPAASSLRADGAEGARPGSRKVEQEGGLRVEAQRELEGVLAAPKSK